MSVILMINIVIIILAGTFFSDIFRLFVLIALIAIFCSINDIKTDVNELVDEKLLVYEQNREQEIQAHIKKFLEEKERRMIENQVNIEN